VGVGLDLGRVVWRIGVGGRGGRVPLAVFIGQKEVGKGLVAYHLCWMKIPESSVATRGGAGWWNVALKIPRPGKALEDRAMVIEGVASVRRDGKIRDLAGTSDFGCVGSRIPFA
jgi:hypothetical protein